VRAIRTRSQLRTLAWEGRGGVTRLAISGAREHSKPESNPCEVSFPSKGTSSSCPSGSSFVLDCANDRREYGTASASGDRL
jgi:hypothetical protein